MNQILYPESIEISLIEYEKKIRKIKNIYLFLFIFSFLCLIFFVVYYYFEYVRLSKQEILSKQLLSSYNIQQLYISNTDSSPVELPHIISESGDISDILGIINIDKINLRYPILSKTTDEFLKIAPCKLHGPAINNNGNFCIAGHNFDNGNFFSNLYLLEINDTIDIYALNRK